LPFTRAATEASGPLTLLHPDTPMANKSSPEPIQFRMRFPPIKKPLPLQRAQAAADGFEVVRLLEQADSSNAPSAGSNAVRRIAQVHAAEREYRNREAPANLRQTREAQRLGAELGRRRKDRPSRT